MVILLNDLSIPSILQAIQYIRNIGKFVRALLYLLLSVSNDFIPVINKQYEMYQFVFKSLVASMKHGPTG